MKGTNTATLNEATMIDALQEYFDKRTINTKQKVLSVSSIDSGYTREFKVIFEEVVTK